MGNIIKNSKNLNIDFGFKVCKKNLPASKKDNNNYGESPHFLPEKIYVDDVSHHVHNKRNKLLMKFKKKSIKTRQKRVKCLC